MKSPRNTAMAAILTAIGVACQVVEFAHATRRESFDPGAALSLTTNVAGASAAHALTFNVSAGDPEIYRATIRYGEGFRVRSFQALGAIGSTIGSYELDFNFDGTADRVMALRSVTASTAYVDVIPDNIFSTGLEPSLTLTGDSLELRLPAGGDANTETRVAPFAARVRLVLFPQLIINPDLGGDYAAVGRLTSVDLDTDGADDDAGTPPEISQLAFMVHINGPVLTPFARLRVDELRLQDRDQEWREWDDDCDRDWDRGRHRRSGRPPDDDGFVADGRYVLGRGSDGVNWRTDTVHLSFASFSQTIPAKAFVGKGHLREYRGQGPGIRRMTLWPDGRFEIDVRRLQLIIPDRRQIFSLRIGNDLGEATITLPLKHGKDHK